MPDQSLRSIVKLIAYHRYMSAMHIQALNKFGNTRIRGRCIKIMKEVMLAECFVNLTETFIIQAIGYCPLHQFFNTITHKLPDLINGAFGHSIAVKSKVTA